jgi:predicted O-methyltransferase YrrM
MVGSTLSGLLALLIVSPIFAILGSTNIKLNYVRDQINKNYIGLREMINIRPLLDGPPLDYDHWSIDPHFGKILSQVIARSQPGVVVECGSGTSTVFIAEMLRHFGLSSKFIALDHLEEYAMRTRNLLEDHGLSHQASVITAPLRERKRCQQPWYDIPPSHFEDGSIDLLVVDGPPAQDDPYARYPAVEVLYPFLANDCIIILDDADRPGEREVASQWASLLNGDLTFVEGPKGTCIINR